MKVLLGRMFLKDIKHGGNTYGYTIQEINGKRSGSVQITASEIIKSQSGVYAEHVCL